MKFSFQVRCRICSSDELEVFEGTEVLESITRAHLRCERCGRTWRVTTTMVAVARERLNA